MNRTDFKENMRHASEDVNMKYMSDIVNRARKSLPANTVANGSANLVIAMEECAELQQEISKYLRGKGDKNGLIEEMADVMLSMEWVKIICDIDDEELKKAMNVKLERMSKKLEDDEWR